VELTREHRGLQRRRDQVNQAQQRQDQGPEQAQAWQVSLHLLLCQEAGGSQGQPRRRSQGNRGDIRAWEDVERSQGERQEGRQKASCLSRGRGSERQGSLQRSDGGLRCSVGRRARCHRASQEDEKDKRQGPQCTEEGQVGLHLLLRCHASSPQGGAWRGGQVVDHG